MAHLPVVFALITSGGAFHLSIEKWKVPPCRCHKSLLISACLKIGLVGFEWRVKSASG